MVYESLSHRFELRSDDVELAALASGLIGDFARPVKDARDAPQTVYSLRNGNGQPRYSLSAGDLEVGATDDVDVLMAYLLWKISTDTVALAEGYLLIHAGAVVTPGGDGIVILGESGSGKTTLVAALVQDGFGYLSDEAAAIALDTQALHPWPRPFGFTPATRALPRFARLFGRDDHGHERHVPVSEIRPHAIAGPSRVRRVIDHRYEAGADTRLEPLSRAAALVQMGSAAPRLRHLGDRGLELLASVIRGADAHTLLSGDLEQAVLAVKKLA